MARIVLNTFGSFGDIHPYLALAIELTKRGHTAVVATSEAYRQKIEAEGVAFAPVRPDIGETMNDPEFLAKLWDKKRGSIFLLRDFLLPLAKQSYDDLAAACHLADLLLTHAVAYGGPIAAEKHNIPWLSIVLQPAILFSRFDPPVIAGAEWARHFHVLGRWPMDLMMKAARMETRRWAKPVLDLRRSLGLSTQANPVLEGNFSPRGTLALFSPQLAAPQLDWPVNTVTTGFLFYDKRGEGYGLPPEHPGGLSVALQRFLADGPAPLLFTLGSSAVMQPGTFYQESAAAAKALGRRAVMLVGRGERASLGLADDVLMHVEEYASYAALMPQCAAIVHQGGIGTVAQALRAGKPMLVVPWAHDQPDNAQRLKRLGVARVQNRSRYSASNAAQHLDHLLNEEAYGRKAAALAETIRQENGIVKAVDLICDFVENRTAR